MNRKRDVGYKAAEYIEDGMVVGLGTGSTAYYMVEALGKRIKEEKLNIVGVTTSNRTREQALSLGIPLKDIDEVNKVDLTIDGADEIDGQFQGVKGGGGALLFEKVVATYSDQVIWIVDDNKLVDQLGAFPLPVEVVPFGSAQLMRLFENKGYKPELRHTEEDEVYETDGGHYIIDLHASRTEDVYELAKWLKQLTGVVEHGLFLDTVNLVLVATDAGVEVQQVRVNPI